MNGILHCVTATTWGYDLTPSPINHGIGNSNAHGVAVACNNPLCDIAPDFLVCLHRVTQPQAFEPHHGSFLGCERHVIVLLQWSSFVG